MSDATAPAVPLWRDRGLRAVVLAFAFNGFLFGVWASRIPAFKDGFALDPAILGLLLLGLAGGAIVSFPFAGVLSERIGPDRVTVLCAWGYGPALVALALAPTPLVLGLILFVFGAFHGAMDVAMNGWGARVEDRLDRPVMSMFHAMFSLGAGLGAATGYAAIGIGLPPLGHFIAAAGIGGAVALAVMIPAQTGRPAPATAEGPRPLLAFPTGPLALVGLIAFTASMGEGAMADWSAVFLVSVVAATEAQAALGFAAFSTTMVITRLLGGVLVARLGPVAATRASAFTAFVGLMIAVSASGLAPVLLGFALMGMGYAVVMPLVFSRAARDPQMPPGPAIASVATLGYGGLLLGPPILGFVAQLTGLRLSFLLLAALAILAFLLAPRLRVDRQG